MSCKCGSIQVEAMLIQFDVMATLLILVHSKWSLCTSYVDILLGARILVYTKRPCNQKLTLSFLLHDGYWNKRCDIWEMSLLSVQHQLPKTYS